MTKAQLIVDLKNRIGPGVEINDTGLVTWLNEAYMYMVDAIQNVQPDFFTKSSLTGTVNGQQEYTLPTDFEKVLMVNIQYAGIWRRALPFSNINQVPIHEFTQSSQGYTADLPRYYLIGSNPTVLGFMPIPTDTATGSLKIWYVYTPAELINDNDVPAISAKYHHLLSLGAYANYLNVDDEHGPSNSIIARFEQRVQAMVESLSDQQVDEPKTIVITNGYDLYVDQGFI